MAFSYDLAQRQLIQIYKESYVALLNRIVEMEAASTPAGFYRSLARETQQILAGLDSTTEAWARSVIPKAYKQGVDVVNRRWIRAGIRPPSLAVGFNEIHTQAVEVLAQNFVQNMRDATQYVGSRIHAQWRQTTLETLVGREATGQTLGEAKEVFLSKVAETGLTGFRDRAGRLWRMDAYADMAIRSTGREVTNIAQINQIVGSGNDLVQFTAHSNTCEICAPLEGRVYSISGKDDRFPHLDIAFSEGFANIHPNCKHSLRAYILDLEDNVDEMVRASNRSFDRDPRTQAQKDAYEKQQERKAQQRATRNQWEEFRALLPDETPKSVTAFSRLKNGNTEKYKELQALAREARS